jgi:predicted  nucleic acid-binding Zn-ribbon protein
MILEGFEIENWSCIKRVAVNGLQPTGVVVLHGPNGTGKSSILAALRACLMDYPSTSASKDLKRWFPKNSGAKPRVSVTFRARGGVWRVTKQFGSKESKVECRTAAGTWKLEQSTAAGAHEQTRSLIGNKDSQSGLQQLLWLTQAEFRLPAPKEFDSTVQAQLRSVLGVLQTPLDDRFLGRVKDEWSRWFSARSKPGEKPKLKKDCPLDKALALLEKHRDELAGIETQYREFEAKMQRAEELGLRVRDLRRQLDEKTPAREMLQQEYDKSWHRLEEHERAVKDVETKAQVLTAAQALRQRRLSAHQELRTAEEEADAAARTAEEKAAQLHAADQRLRELRVEIQTLRNTGRDLQGRRNSVSDRRQFLSLQEQAKIVREKLHQAEETSDELERLKEQARERAAPEEATLQALEENRTQAARLRAELDAAAIALTLVRDTGAAAPTLALDGARAVEATNPEDGTLIRCSVRRRAEITLPGWGRAEITRGSDQRSLDEIENALNELDRVFADDVAPFGISATDTAALGRLRAWAAAKQVRDGEMTRKQAEIDRLAPQGLDHLRKQVARLEHKLLANESAPASAPTATDLPKGADELEQLGKLLNEDIEKIRKRIDNLEQQVRDIEHQIEGLPDIGGPTVKKSAAGANCGHLGLREDEASAKKTLAGLMATVELRRDTLKRMPTAEQIDLHIQTAQKDLDEARLVLEAGKLTECEQTIRERLNAADEGLKVLLGQVSDAQKDLHQIQGAISQSEGLHQRRAAAAARFEELAAQTERERLESEAVDQLYALFEECREKQLGTVMGPIHDRLLRWMRLLRVGGYQSVSFNDQFLPEKLIGSDGATESTLEEESTGTIEQLGLMVRLALGSMLSTPEEPVVAILDDPLTHSDVVRLDRMRAILKHASLGDPAITPPAGPLQILVFTCHPEWFAIDGALVIDLSKPNVLTRND